MIKKYLHQTGITASETSFNIWLFAVATEALTQNFDAEKCGKLLAMVVEFANGNYMKFNGKPDEMDDLNFLVEELEALLR